VDGDGVTVPCQLQADAPADPPAAAGHESHGIFDFRLLIFDRHTASPALPVAAPDAALGTSFPNSVWERMASTLCFERRRDTEFRGIAVPKQSLGTRVPNQESDEAFEQVFQ